MQVLINIFFFLSFFNMNVFFISTMTISKILLLVIVSIFLVDLILKNGVVKKNVKNNTFKLSFFFLIVWLIYGIISLTWSNDISEGLKILNSLILQIGILLVMILTIKNERNYISIINTISCAVIIHNFIGWYEILTKNYHFAPSEYISYYAYRGFPVSTFFNTNNFATFLSIGFFMIYVSIQSTSKRILRFSLYTSLVSTLLLIVMTDSRGNLGATIIGIGIIIFFKIHNSSFSKVKLIFIYIVGVIGLLVVFNLIFENMEVVKELFVKEKSGESNNTRVNLMKNGIEFFKETNLMGVGAGGLDYWMLNKSIYSTGGVLKMHNWWIEILSTYGIFIFLLYIIDYYLIFRYYLRLSLNVLFKNRNKCIGFTAMLGAFILSSISPSTLFLTPWMWVYFAVIIYGINIYGHENEGLVNEFK